ncbi:tetratricopeptide repeat protein [Desulfoplanes sp.]
MKKVKFFLMVVACVVLVCGCKSVSRQGKQLIGENKYDAAIRLFQEHLAEDPDDMKVREQLGYAYLKGNHYQEAIAEFNRVLKEEPESELSILYLGMAYLRTNDLANAVTAWRRINDTDKKVLKEEVNRLLTLVEMAEAKRMAKKAVAAEGSVGAGSTGPNTYAVMYYNDLSPEKGLVAVQKSLAAMTISDLSKFSGLQVVERARLQALVDEMKLGTTGAVDMDSAPKAGRLLGASHVVTGTLSTLLRDLRINTSLVDCNGKEECRPFLVKERLPEFFRLQKEIVYQIINQENISLSRSEKKLLEDYHTENFDAFMYYGQGLDATDQGDWKQAKDYYAMAIELDPDFVLARQARDRSPDGMGVSIAQINAMAVDASAVNAVGDAFEPMIEDAMHDQERDDSSSGFGNPDPGRGGGNGGRGGGGGGGDGCH